jgi:hypothetical protein
MLGTECLEQFISFEPGTMSPRKGLELSPVTVSLASTRDSPALEGFIHGVRVRRMHIVVRDPILSRALANDPLQALVREKPSCHQFIKSDRSRIAREDRRIVGRRIVEGCLPLRSQLDSVES